MARVQGALLSLSASGSVGNALTFKTWKGIGVCSVKSQPSNPKTLTQMLGRGFFAAGGKITKKADLVGDVVTYVKTMLPAGQSWASYFIREVMGSNNVNIAAAKVAYATVGNATVKGFFDTAASQAGIEAVDLDGTANTQVAAGLALWAAYAASNRLSDPSAPAAVTAATEAQVFAYTDALTGILPA